MKCIDLIIKYRTKRGITQAECANIINMSRSGYNEIEHNRTRLSADDFVKLAVFLQINPNECFNILDTEYISFSSKELNSLKDVTKMLSDKLK